MSEQEFHIELTGNIKVYIPIKRDPWVDRINAEWDALIDEVSQRRAQQSSAIAYPECLYPLRAA